MPWNKARFILLTVLPLTALGLAGCKSHKPFEPGFVYRQWSERMSEMGIFPVYPPREDIVVGDVYALPLHPYDSTTVGFIGGLGSAGVHVSYLGDTQLEWAGFQAKLERYYKDRPYAADTPTGEANANSPMSRITGYPDDTNRTNVFGAGSTARFRQVAFPDYTVSTIDQKSLSAVIPIEAIMTSLNFNHNDVTAVHFKISQAESYGVTTEELLADIYTSGFITNTAADGVLISGSPDSVISVVGARMAHAMFADTLQALIGDRERKLPKRIIDHVGKTARAMHGKIFLALISEVFFARSMDITIDRKTATGTSVAARPLAVSELQELSDMGLTRARKVSQGTNSTETAITTNPNGSSTNFSVRSREQTIDVTEGDTALDLARKLRALETPDGVGDVGGSVKVVNVTASNIGLRRTYERPIVVGVRGVLVRLDVTRPVELPGVKYSFSTNSSGTITTNAVPVTNQWLKVVGTAPLDLQVK